MSTHSSSNNENHENHENNNNNNNNSRKRSIIVVDVVEKKESIGNYMNRYMWSHNCDNPGVCKVNNLLKRSKTFILEEECSICYEVKTTGNQICLRCEGSCCTACWTSVTKCPLCRVDVRPLIVFKHKLNKVNDTNKVN